MNRIAVTTTLVETAASNRLPSDRLAQLQLQLQGAAVGGSSGGDSGAVQIIGGTYIHTYIQKLKFMNNNHHGFTILEQYLNTFTILEQ